MRRLLASALALAAVLSVADPATAQDPVTAGANQGGARAGEEITVFGSGWPGGERLQVSVCGNQALNLSIDCDLPSSRSVVTDADGSFQMDMDVAVPPEACPCVLFFVAQGTAATVRFPFDVIGAPTAPTAGAPRVSSPALEVVSARVEGVGPWGAWFGGAPHRTLVLTVRNTSAEAVVPELDVAWGKGADPKRILDLPGLDAVPAGEDRAFRLPFELDALSLGRYTIAGEVTAPGGPVEFSTTTNTLPWGWIALVGLVLQVWIVRRWRRGRSNHPPVQPIDLPDDGGGSAQVVLELPPGAIAELPPARPLVDTTSSNLMAQLSSAIQQPATSVTQLRSGDLAQEDEPSNPPAPNGADIVLTHAQALFDEAEREHQRAARARRVANQLAEALIARAAAQSDVWLDRAAQQRDAATKVLDAAQRRADELEEMERQRAAALTEAQRRAQEAERRAEEAEAVAHMHAVALEQAQRRSEELEEAERQRVAAREEAQRTPPDRSVPPVHMPEPKVIDLTEHDPVGRAIRRALVTVFGS